MSLPTTTATTKANCYIEENSNVETDGDNDERIGRYYFELMKITCNLLTTSTIELIGISFEVKFSNKLLLIEQEFIELSCFIQTDSRSVVGDWVPRMAQIAFEQN